MLHYLIATQSHCTLCQTSGASLSLNRSWITSSNGNEDFFSKILFRLLEAQIRVDTAFPWSNNGIYKCPEEPENTAIPEGQGKLKGHRF